MARTLRQTFQTYFDKATSDKAERLLAAGKFEIPVDTPHRFGVVFEGSKYDNAVLLEVAGDKRVLKAFCTCDSAISSRHRCEHVTAAIQVAEEEGEPFVIPGQVRVLVPKCGPRDDATTARELWEEFDFVDGEAEFEGAEDATRPASPPSTASAGPASPRTNAGLPVQQPKADPFANLDRAWKLGLESLGRHGPGRTKQRPTELVFRLHLTRDWHGRPALLVEIVTEAAESRAVAPKNAVAAANGHERTSIEPGTDGAAPHLRPGTSRFNAQRGSLERLSTRDRELVLLVLGACGGTRYDAGMFSLDPDHAATVVRRLMRSGRCVVGDPAKWSTQFGSVRPAREVQGASDPVPAARWDDGPPWHLRLDLSRSRKPGVAVLHASLIRHGEVCSTANLLATLPDLLIFRDGAAQFGSPIDEGWRSLAVHPLEVPVRSVPALLERLAEFDALPPMHVDPALAAECAIDVVGAPAAVAASGAASDAASRDSNGAAAASGSSASPQRPHLHVSHPEGSSRLLARATLRSGSAAMPVGGPTGCVIDPVARRIVARDHDADARAVEDLRMAGVVPTSGLDNGTFRTVARDLPQLVRQLGGRGWTIEADGNVLKAPQAMRSSVRWGVDWFDLEGEVDFGDSSIPLATLLAAIRERKGVVTLGDGTVGVIPDEWLKRLGLLARSGAPSGEGTRFAPSALLLLEAALGEETVDRDEATRAIRAGLRNFAGIRAVDPPPSFSGELRPYQREGLGWLGFLREFGLGGCLADDMGLGKTVQVLAMLESRRVERAAGAASGDSPRTSLVVAPRSLVFNWMREAERFTPSLRVLDASGADRSIDAARFADHDVVVTTYGILRRDIAALREQQFDYVILDEAQAIKNAASQTAHATKLLRSKHRLAMSGTPVENHLGELWSLVEFLNPALVGPAGTKADGASRLRAADLADPDAAAMAAKAVRPFVLRRTKAQVAPQLPDRIEKTLVCQLEGAQRRLYDLLKREVRASVMGKVSEMGIKRAGIAVLEALLRLRQAACHPALVDPTRKDAPSAKLDSLIPTLAELAAEGHKTLVFSQFTSFLDLVEPRLAAAGLKWVRLDGTTRNRDQPVAAFQSDPSCPVFLISLKAGGLGLNLTSADHVVLLDPWWNPAVEAQAIDRAHRIGQHRTVIATRLIAANTVEQRILELQARKRALADAVMGGDRGPLAGMTREDLEALLE